MLQRLIPMALAVLAVTACERSEPDPFATGVPVKREAAELYATRAPDTALQVGEKERVQLAIEPEPGFKINLDFPWQFRFESNTALEVTTPTVAHDAIALTEASASIPVEVTPRRKGDLVLKGKGDFSVCNDDKCERYMDRDVVFALRADARPTQTQPGTDSTGSTEHE